MGKQRVHPRDKAQRCDHHLLTFFVTFFVTF